MNSFQAHASRLRWITGLIIFALLLVLAACGGGSSDDDSGDALADSAPADDIPADSVPADVVPADSVPADSAPADTSPADSAPDNDTSPPASDSATGSDSDTPDSDTAGIDTADGDTAGSGAAAAQATQEPLAALVNGQPITLAAFERERERRSVGLDIQPATAAAFEADVLQSMIDQVLIEQAAAERGIVVTDAEIDAELDVQETIVAQNGQTLQDVLAEQGYTLDEYRAVQRGMLLALKVSQVVADVSPLAVQVHSRHILVTDEATARNLIARIQQGEDFAQLAMEYTLDSSTQPTGGDLDWVSEGDLLQPEVEAVIFALEPGQLAPDPVASSLGYHVIQVLDRVEDRPLSQAALAVKKQQAFLEWLQTQREAADIERYVGTGSQ